MLSTSVAMTSTVAGLTGVFAVRTMSAASAMPSISATTSDGAPLTRYCLATSPFAVETTR